MTDNNLKETQKPGEIKEFILNDKCKGYSVLLDNCWNYTVFAQDSNISIFENEFNAGFVQSKLQGYNSIRAARDNVWRNFLICGTPQDNLFIDIPDGALEICAKSLLDNYRYLYNWLREHSEEKAGKNIKRLLFRMAGIFAGVRYENPIKISFEDLDPDKINPEEFILGGYDQDKITFLDIYLINAEMDMFDVVADALNLGYGEATTGEKVKQDHCSAFAKYGDDGELYLTHNSWCGFYAQSCSTTYVIGEDFITQNAYSQGQFGSNTDFGFNKYGIGFNETTHAHLYNESKQDGIWLCWRSALAEMFSTSIQEFYEYISIDNTGTYLNGYMLIDANKGEIGVVEMSYKRFVLFVSDGKELKVTDSTGYLPTRKDYDPHLITPTHIFGINMAVSKSVSYDLETIDTRPMRRVQFWQRIGLVKDIETAKSLITYNQDKEPLSIYGRWDKGLGATEFGKSRPDGSIDAKAMTATMIKEFLANVKFIPNKNSKKTTFWMKYGTPILEGKPFIWSESLYSQFKSPQCVDFVPDAIDGKWNLVPVFMD